jgi:hypothetical protein
VKVFNNTMVHETKIAGVLTKRKEKKMVEKNTYIAAIKEINMQCGNYLWSKFSNFKSNDIC